MDRQDERDGFAKGRIGGSAIGGLHAAAVARWALGAGRAALAGYKPKRRESVAELPAFPRWAVARVRAGFEFLVADDLTASGDFWAYAPHRVIVHKSARVRGSNAVRRKVERDYPVFSGYVFVGCREGVWLGRDSHRDVLDVLGDALGRPGVSQTAMATLNRLHVCGALQPRPWPAVAKGDAVQVEIGGVDLRGVVTELTRAGVRVEASMLGRVVLVEIGFDKIKDAVI